jgi:hypothetical protein
VDGKDLLGTIHIMSLAANAPKIFGFPGFLAGLALMVLAWTIADVVTGLGLRLGRYPFRGSHSQFFEIKTYQTPLLRATPFCAGCWSPSDDLCGAVGKIQGTVSYASETIFGKPLLTDSASFPTAE